MLVFFAIGVILWTVYGIWIGSLPIITANVVTLGLILFLLWMKIRFK